MFVLFPIPNCPQLFNPQDLKTIRLPFLLSEKLWLQPVKMSKTSLVANCCGLRLQSCGKSAFADCLPIWPSSQSPQPKRLLPAIAKAWFEPLIIFFISLLEKSLRSRIVGVVIGSAIFPALF